MVSADLHAYYDFIRLAGYHGAEAGYRFCQCKGGAAVQDAEGLAGTVVYGHGSFYAVFRGVGVLNAQIAH